MALFKQKITIYELLYAVLRKIIKTPELFPADEILLEQGDFNKQELKHIHAERVKLAVVYAQLYVIELSHKGKIKVDEELCKAAYGQAVLAAINSDDTNFKAAGIDQQEFINTIDGYTMYIAQHSDKKTDDYFLAFQHFQEVVFVDKKSTEIPIAAVTLAKHIRNNVSKMLVNDLLKNYKVV